MPKTKLRQATQSDSQQARVDAASKLVEGDRVIHRQTGKFGKFIAINRGFALIEVWVEFESDTERSVPISCNPLDLELIQQCHESTQSSVASAGSQDCATEPSLSLDSNTNSELPNSLKQIPTAELSFSDASQIFPATTISEPSESIQDNSTLWSEAVPAKEIASPTRMEKGLTTLAQDCGGKCGELSRSSDPSSSCGKTLLPPDVPSQDSNLVLSPELSGVLPASGMYASGKLSVPSPRAHPTDEIASSSSRTKKLLPTPMAHSRAKTTYSSPGQDKLEQKLRDLGVIPPGHVSHPAVREFMMGFPDGWTDITDTDGGPATLPDQSAPQSVVSPIELQELPHLETPVHPPKPPLHGEDLQQSRSLNRVGEVTADADLQSDLTGSSNVAMEQFSLDIGFNANQIIPDEKPKDINHATITSGSARSAIVSIQPDVQKDIEFLSLSLIATDGGTQSRAALNADTIADYAEAMDAGATFPPVLVFYDGQDYWLADGFHRLAAAKKLGWTDIAVEIRQGSRRDTVLYSVGANATHGLRRTNADKRRAVEILLRDEQWGQWSDNAIAKACGVSNRFVAKLRSESSLSMNGSQIERTVVRNGKIYTQDTGNIGTKPKQVGTTSISDGIVVGLKQKDASPVPIPYESGDVFRVRCKSGELKKYDGCWAIVTQVNEYTVSVHVHDQDLQMTPEYLQPIDSKSESNNIKAIHERILRIRECGLLDRVAYTVLESLGRQTFLTELESEFLTVMEKKYGIIDS